LAQRISTDATLLIDKSFSIPYFENMKFHLTANEFAKLVRVDRATVSRWIKTGRITTALKQPGSGYWQIPISVYAEMVKKDAGR
jgi:hypothetical protein